jgi:hypothetical protein
MRKTLIIISDTSKNDNHSHSQFECEDFKKLNDLKRQKRLTPCLELLEKHGWVGDVAIFILSQLNETWRSFGNSELAKIENQRGLW